MIPTPLRYALLQTRMATHYLIEIGIPRWTLVLGLVASVAGVAKLVDGVGEALAGLYTGAGGDISWVTTISSPSGRHSRRSK